MRKRIELGTDIAMVGLWDPSHERHDLKNSKHADFRAALETESVEGRLFFIDTRADGGFLTDIYVNEEPDSEYLKQYVPVDREFLVRCESGRLIAGGIEDFTSEAKQITAEKNEFEMRPGFYALRVFELVDEERFDDFIQNQIGADDFACYQGKSGGFPLGVLLFIVGMVALFMQFWVVGLAVVAAWIGYLIVRSRLRSRDGKFLEIAKRIEILTEQYPPFLYLLREIQGVDAIRGGWHELP